MKTKTAGEVIIERSEKQGLTFRELANEAGVSRQTVLRARENEGALTTIALLLRVLKVPHKEVTVLMMAAFEKRRRATSKNAQARTQSPAKPPKRTAPAKSSRPAKLPKVQSRSPRPGGHAKQPSA